MWLLRAGGKESSSLELECCWAHDEVPQAELYRHDCCEVSRLLLSRIAGGVCRPLIKRSRLLEFIERVCWPVCRSPRRNGSVMSGWKAELVKCDTVGRKWLACSSSYMMFCNWERGGEGEGGGNGGAGVSMINERNPGLPKINGGGCNSDAGISMATGASIGWFERRESKYSLRFSNWRTVSARFLCWCSSCSYSFSRWPSTFSRFSRHFVAATRLRSRRKRRFSSSSPIKTSFFERRPVNNVFEGCLRGFTVIGPYLIMGRSMQSWSWWDVSVVILPDSTWRQDLYIFLRINGSSIQIQHQIWLFFFLFHFGSRLPSSRHRSSSNQHWSSCRNYSCRWIS